MMQIDVIMYICDSCFDIINTHINAPSSHVSPSIWYNFSVGSTTSTAPNVTVTSGSTPAPGPRTTPAGPQRPPTAFQLPTGAFQIPPGAFGAPGGPQPGGVPQFMPPAFLQNIIQMATGQAMGGQGMPGQAGNHQGKRFYRVRLVSLDLIHSLLAVLFI